VSEEYATESEEARQRRMETLLREVVETINAGPVEGREVWRDAAVDVVREGVRVAERPRPETAADAAAGGSAFNPFGIGIPLILMGSILVFLFPLVGLLLFAAAALMIAWGVGATLLTRT
jgi:hypothetical protein